MPRDGENEELNFHNDLLSDVPETPDPAPQRAPVATEAQDTTQDSGGMPDRDDQGRFTRRNSEAPQQETYEEEPLEASPEAEEREETSEEDDDWIEPPSRMAVEDQRLFHKLPREGRDLVARLAKDKDALVTKATQEASRLKKQYEGIEKVIGPRRAQFQRDGSTPEQVFHTLLSLSDYATQNPREFITWFAKENNIDLGHGFAPQQQPAYVDPELQKRDQEIAQLRQQLQGITGQVSSWNDAAQQTRVKQVHSYLASFREAKGQDGQLLHPYFDEVENEMTTLLERGLAKDLDDAYDRAVYANPSTRERILQRRTAAQEKERRSQARLHAEKAQRAGSSLPAGSSNGIARRPPQKGRSAAHTMSEIWDQQMGETY